MTGKDTAAYFKGLLVGAIFIGVVVVSITIMTNKKFDAHEATPAAETH